MFYALFPDGRDKDRPDIHHERTEYQEDRCGDCGSSFHRPSSSDCSDILRFPFYTKGILENEHHSGRRGIQREIAPAVDDFEAAEKALPRLSNVVGKVYQ